MIHETVCADCGLNTPWEDQFAIRIENGDTKIVCRECAKKYGLDTTQSDLI